MADHSLSEVIQIKGFVATFHRIVFDKKNAPTDLHWHNVAVAPFYAGKGFAVIMPDKIGESPTF